MKKSPNTFWTEADRLAEVERYKIANTPHEAVFDELAQQAARSSESPIALITFLTEDHQWFKAAVGTQLTGTVRAISFCNHAIEQDGTMIVQDASNDARFVDNPLVTGETNIRFYAGVPLRSPQGMPLGTLCVLDQKPRIFTDEQRRALESLAQQVIEKLELRKSLLSAIEPHTT